MDGLYLGIDIGGTKIAAGILDTEGRVHGRASCLTNDARGRVIHSCVELAEAAILAGGLERNRILGVGLALPGPTDLLGPTLLVAPALAELEAQPLTEPFQAAFGVPVFGENDARAAALGEALFGAGMGKDLVAYFTISTGVGGGVVCRGRPVRGAHGFASEFGHQVVERDGDPCSCGGFGCLETIASGPAIARRARAMLARRPGGLLADDEWRASRPWDAVLVAAAAREGDGLAVHVFDEVAEAVGLGVVNVVTLLDPDCVVLGGGVMQSADLLMPAIRQIVAERAMPALSRPLEVTAALLGPDVGWIGAATLAMIRAD